MLKHDQADRPCAGGDIEEIKARAASEEGIRQMKQAIDWGREKEAKLTRAQRVRPLRRLRRMTR